MFTLIAVALAQYEPPGSGPDLWCTIENLDPLHLCPTAVFIGEGLLWLEPSPPDVWVEVLFKDHAGKPEEQLAFGPGAPWQRQVWLAKPLEADDAVWVRLWFPDGHTETSSTISPKPAPNVIDGGVLASQVDASAQFLTVDGATPGAVLEVWSEGWFYGFARATAAHQIVPLYAPLPAGAHVDVYARMGNAGAWGPGDDVVYGGEPLPIPPRILPPLAFGASGAWVSHVRPGAQVWLVDEALGGVLGVGYAEDSIVHVPTCRVPAATRPWALHDSAWQEGPVEGGIVGPRYGGDHAAASYNHGMVDAPEEEQKTGFTGLLYHPTDLVPGDRTPLVVIAHGEPPQPDDGEAPFIDHGVTGYAELASHLARRGMTVAVIQFAKRSYGYPPENDLAIRSARMVLSTSALRAISAAGPLWPGGPQGVLDGQPVALIGHSLGGGAAAYAQAVLAFVGVDVRATVGIAPILTDMSQSPAHYLGIMGTKDYFFARQTEGVVDPFDALHQFNRAQPFKAQLLVPNANHNDFNRVWDEMSTPPPGSISGDAHVQVLIDHITAWLDAHFGLEPSAAGFLQGHVKAPGSASTGTAYQFEGGSSSNPTSIGAPLWIDAFNDATPTTNDLGQPSILTMSATTVPASTTVQPAGGGLSLPAMGAAWTTTLASFSAGPTDVLSFKVRATGAFAAPLSVTLSDGTHSATIDTSPLLVIRGPWATEALTPADLLQTARAPLDAFTAIEPDLDLGALTSLTIQQVGADGVIVDDVVVEPGF